jgi:hypothetical protein
MFIEIEERYANYNPPFNVTNIIRKLIEPVPEKYLRGLRKVLIVESGSLSRRDRFGKTWSRRRKHSKDRILGRYYYNNGVSWIELRIDRIVASWKGTPRPLLWIPAIRFLLVGNTFYHELGHHIHRTVRPEFREKEDVADNWGVKLSSNFIRKRYWYLLPVLLPASWLLRNVKPNRRTYREG